MVLHSLSCHPSSWQGSQRDGKTGASLGWLPAHNDGSVGAGARAELPDVNQRIGFGTCPADGRLCSRLCSVSWADALFFPRTWRRAWVS